MTLRQHCSTLPVVNDTAKSGPEMAKRALKEKDWSQQDLAIALGVNPSAVCRWLKGRKSPGLANAVKLYKLLGVPTDQWI